MTIHVTWVTFFVGLGVTALAIVVTYVLYGLLMLWLFSNMMSGDTKKRKRKRGE